MFPWEHASSVVWIMNFQSTDEQNFQTIQTKVGHNYE